MGNVGGTGQILTQRFSDHHLGVTEQFAGIIAVFYQGRQFYIIHNIYEYFHRAVWGSMSSFLPGEVILYYS